MKKKTLFKRYWKDTDRVGYVDGEYFSEWLDSLVLPVVVNGEVKTPEQFRKEFFINDFLYVTNASCNHNDNTFIIKDNLEREWYVQDPEMLDKTVELIDMPEYIDYPDFIEADELPL